MKDFLSLQDIEVRYGQVVAVDHVSFAVPEGEIVCLLGPSGCGKTTLLRTISGFVRPQHGQVLVKGRDFTRVPVHKRRMGLVFQNYALFPHLRVYDNVAYGLRMQGKSRAEIEDTVKQMLDVVDLPQFADRYPAELSGGQQQRVALARALAIRPDVLLLDEPLSNLDAQLRLRMRSEIRRIQRKFRVTTVFVTHDQAECFAIADQVIILRDGKIRQHASPQEILEKPADQFVAKFIGFENIIELAGRHVAFRAEDVALGEADDSLTMQGDVAVCSREGRNFLTIFNTSYGEIRAVTATPLEEGCTGIKFCVPHRFLIDLPKK